MKQENKTFLMIFGFGKESVCQNSLTLVKSKQFTRFSLSYAHFQVYFDIDYIHLKFTRLRQVIRND